MNAVALAIREHVDLRHLNTFHVSAKARWLVTISDTAQLQYWHGSASSKCHSC